MIALLISLASASPLIEALQTELERSSDLSIPDAPPVYHLRYHLASAQQYELVTTFGSVLEEDHTPYHQMGIELRVGTPDYDSSGFGGWEDGFLRRPLPLLPTPHSVRQVAWRGTDTAYKQAIEQFARKSAQFKAPADYPGDYWIPEPITANDGAPPPFDIAPIRALGIELSQRLLPAGERLLKAEAHIGVETGTITLIDTEGTNLTRPLAEVSIRALATLRAADGELLTDSRLWSVRSTTDLPPKAQMLAAIDAMRDALLSRAEAPVLEEEYVGPMIFEGDAALALYRFLLMPQFEGTPAKVPFESWFGNLGDDKGAVRVGRRVLPEGWSVKDDPMADPNSPAAFQHDWDGRPIQQVDLVEDGIVRDLLMSSVPRKNLQPNGHARGFLGQRASGKASQLTILPEKHKKTKALVKKGLKMASAYGLDHVIVIRRLQDYSVLGLHNTASMFGGGGPDFPPPVEIIRVRADGSEEVLRGASFAGIQNFILRDIAMAGPLHTQTFLASFSGNPKYLAPIEGMPTTITAPDILVREVELVPTSRDPRDTPILHPLAP